MSKVGYGIVKLWVGFMSIHPYWLLYLKSDFYYLLVYHVVRYRRKVVRQNLVRSFPEKDAKAIKTIEKHFYRNLCDLFVEAPKMLRTGPEGFRKRISYFPVGGKAQEHFLCHTPFGQLGMVWQDDSLVVESSGISYLQTGEESGLRAAHALYAHERRRLGDGGVELGVEAFGTATWYNERGADDGRPDLTWLGIGLLDGVPPSRHLLVHWNRAYRQETGLRCRLCQHETAGQGTL